MQMAELYYRHPRPLVRSEHNITGRVHDFSCPLLLPQPAQSLISNTFERDCDDNERAGMGREKII